MVWVLHLNSWDSGASFRNQSQSKNKARRISFDIQLQIALKCWITCYQSNVAFSKLYGIASRPRYWIAKLHMSDSFFVKISDISWSVCYTVLPFCIQQNLKYQSSLFKCNIRGEVLKKGIRMNGKKASRSPENHVIPQKILQAPLPLAIKW